MGQASSSFWDDIVPRVHPEKCRRCADCPPVAACPAMGFRREGPEDVPVVDESFCFGCFTCANACPYGAIILPRQKNP